MISSRRNGMINFRYIRQRKKLIRCYSSRNNSTKLPKDNATDCTENEQKRKRTSSKTQSQLSVSQKYLVPRVQSTDGIPKNEVQTEGLFAGYRPLFLGNSSVTDEEKQNVLDNFFASFAKINAEKSANNEEVKVQDLIDELQSEKMGNNTSNFVIPWNASLSGLVYNDTAFKSIPKNVLAKLRPYKLIKMNKTNGKSKEIKQNDMIVMKVHNSKINDELSMVDLNSCDKTAQIDSQIEDGLIIGVTRETMLDAKNAYIKEMENLFKFGVFKHDLRLFTRYSEKISKFLSREMAKLTNMQLHSSFNSLNIPLYAYLPGSIYSRNSMKRKMRKEIFEYASPLLTTILDNCKSEAQQNEFLEKYQNKCNFVINYLTNRLFTNIYDHKVVDCVTSSSPIPNFKRIYWLKKSKRHTIFNDNNIDMEYVFSVDNEYDITRSNIRYMRYPVVLNKKSFKKAFADEGLLVNSPEKRIK